MKTKDQISVDFGNRLRRLRKIAGMTQTRLAVRAGLHYTYVGAVERGKRNPSLKSIEKLAVGLKREIAEFFPSLSMFTPEEEVKSEIMEVLRGKELKDLKLILKLSECLE